MEYSRYLVRDGRIERSLERLPDLLTAQPHFFAEAFATPEFMQHKTIIGHLRELHNTIIRDQIKQLRELKLQYEQIPDGRAYSDLQARVESEITRMDELVESLRRSLIR